MAINIHNVTIPGLVDANGWLNINQRTTTVTGTTAHHELENLDYDSAGHTGFASSLELDAVSGTLQSAIDQNTLDIATISGAAGSQTFIGLTDTPSSYDDDKYLRSTASGLEWVAGTAGITDHDNLNNLDYASSGHTGFQPAGDYATNTDLATVSGLIPTDFYTQSEVDDAIAAASGTTDHSALDNLAYADSGHTGFQPAGDYATSAELTTASGDIVSQIPSVAGYATEAQLTTTSGDIVSQFPTDFYSQSEVDTISGSLQSQIDNIDGFNGVLGDATFNSLAGTTSVSGVMANTDEVLVAMYGTDPDDNNSAFGVGASNTSREIITIGHNYRIRQTGTITKIDFDSVSATEVGEATSIYLKIWRENGSNFDLVATSEDFISQCGDGVNEITFTTPITGVQEGDYYSIRVEKPADANNAGCIGADNNTTIGTVSTYYITNTTPSSSNYDWTGSGTQVASSAIALNIYMEAPELITIGDSVMAGRLANYTFLMTNGTDTDLDGTIAYNVANEYGWAYQNMAIGGEISSEIEARFDEDVVALKPKIVVINTGLNDIADSVSWSTFSTKMTSILDKCIDNDIIPIVLALTPAESLDATGCQTKDTWNEDLETLVNTYNTAIWVDANSTIGAFRTGGDAGNLWDLNATYDGGDGVHLNASGYQAVAADIVSVINNSVISGIVITNNTITFADGTTMTTAAVTDHGDLTGLDGDDHSQYHNDSRAATWLSSNHETTYNHANLHTRSHAITSTSDHTAGNWKILYSNGSGQIQELTNGAAGKVLTGNGATSAPSWEDATGGMSDLVDDTTPQLGGALDANGNAIVAADHGTAATDEVVNVCYGTGSPPTASTTTEGTLWIKYTA